MINDNYRQSNDVAKASPISADYLQTDCSEAQKIREDALREEIFQLKQRVDTYSEDCHSVEDSLQKEYSSDRGIRE